MSTEFGSGEVQALKARLEELEVEVRTLRTDVRRGRRRRKDSLDAIEAPEAVSRRRMLGMLKGAAAAGAGMAVIGSSNTAFADAVGTGAGDGDALQIGGENTNTSQTTKLSGSAPNSFLNDAILHVAQTHSIGGTAFLATVGGSSSGAGVIGMVSGTETIGVWGSATNEAGGVGVRGNSLGGAALLVQDNADAYVSTDSAEMPPTTGTWSTGSFVNSLGHIWYCYVAGVGSASKWARLSSPFVPLTPTRVYDSRAGAPTPTGVLAAGSNRLVSVKDGRNSAGAVTVTDLVPAGAKAIAANVTVTGTTNGGFLAINPGGNTVAGASTINWFGTGQTLANGVTLSINASREVTVICGSGSGGSTGFIIDVMGYFL